MFRSRSLAWVSTTASLARSSRSTGFCCRGRCSSSRGQEQEVLHHGAHPLGLALDPPHRGGHVLFRGQGTLAVELGEPPDRHEGSAKLMRSVSGKAAHPFLRGHPGCEGGLNVAEHRVERAAQPAHFRGGILHIDAARQVTRSDGCCCLFDPRQRTEGPGHRPGGNEEGKNQRQEAHPDHHQRGVFHDGVHGSQRQPDDHDGVPLVAVQRRSVPRRASCARRFRGPGTGPDRALCLSAGKGCRCPGGSPCCRRTGRAPGPGAGASGSSPWGCSGSVPAAG